MKSGIAGVLILAGIGALIASSFVGKRVSAADEWSEEKIEEFSQITATIHNPQRNAEAGQEQLERLKEMQQELIDAQGASASKKSMFKLAGLTMAILGVCLQLWAWMDKKKAGG